MYSLTANGIPKPLHILETVSRDAPLTGFTTGYELTANFGRISMYVIELEEFTAIYFDFRIREDVVLGFQQDIPALELYVALLHSLPTAKDGVTTTLDEFQYGFRYSVSPNWLFPLKKGHHYAFSVFQFPTSFLKSFISGYPSLTTLFVHRVCNTYFSTNRKMHFTGEMLSQHRKFWHPTIEATSQHVYLGLLLRILFIYAFREMEHLYRPIIKNLSGIEKKVQDAAQIIAGNPDDRFTIISLSRRVNTNPVSLSIGFRTLFQQSVFEYITAIRLEKAVRLLLATKLTEDDIAQQVGYSTGKALMKAFKKNFGCTPGTVRSV